MNDDQISRQAAIEALPSAQSELIEQIKWERDTAIQQLKELGYGLGQKPRMDAPTIEPERKNGKWIKDGRKWMCNQCGELVYDDDHNYCPNCGAKMRERRTDD